MQKAPSVAFVRNCRDCGRTVCFSDEIKGVTGKRTPLDPGSLTPHHCQDNDEYLVSQAVQYIAEVNKRLGSCQLKIMREDKQ